MLEDEGSASSADAVSMYHDVVQGRDRPRRGKRKPPRGPFSTAEKYMRRAYSSMNVAMHNMDGELADLVAREFTVWFKLSDQIMRRWSFEHVKDPGPEDWNDLREELGIAREKGEDKGGEFDVGDLVLLACVIDRMKWSRGRARRLSALKRL